MWEAFSKVPGTVRVHCGNLYYDIITLKIISLDTNSFSASNSVSAHSVSCVLNNCYVPHYARGLQEAWVPAQALPRTGPVSLDKSLNFPVLTFPPGGIKWAR